MTLKQIHKALKNGYDVVMYCKYWNRQERHLLESDIYGQDFRYDALRHTIKCIKQDFIDISTLYTGTKSDCKFAYAVQY